MWPNPQFPADLVTFTEEILNGKLRILCSVKTITNPMERQIFDYSLMLYRIQIHQGVSTWLMQVNLLHNTLMPE